MLTRSGFRPSWKTWSPSTLPAASAARDEAGETRALVIDRFDAQGAIAASRVAVRTLAEIQREQAK